MLDAVLKVLSNGLFGNLVGIGGIGLAIWAYYRTRQFPELSVFIRREQLVGADAKKGLKALAVTFDGAEVQSVSRAEAVIWNSGNVPFRRADLVAGDLPSLRLPSGSRVLREFVLATSTPAGQVSLSQSQDRVDMSWEYLNPGDGCAFAIVYEGDASDPIGVGGSIIGLRTGLILRTAEPRSKRDPASNIMIGVLAFFAALILLEMWLDFPYLRWEESLTSTENKRIFFAVFWFTIFGLLAGIVWMLSRPNIPSSLDPRRSSR